MIEEFNDLIGHGAGQPGIRDIEEMMRMCWALDNQARDLAALYGVGSVSTVASSTGSRALPFIVHADVE